MYKIKNTLFSLCHGFNDGFYCGFVGNPSIVKRKLADSELATLERLAPGIELVWIEPKPAKQAPDRGSPAHPLVVDKATNLMRKATQDDFDRMHEICCAYDAIMKDFGEKLRMGEYLRKDLDTRIGR